MTTDRNILTLVQWLSPAYPIGAFTYSHGLEQAIQTGALQTGRDLAAWLTDILLHGSGRNDCIILRAAYVCEDRAALTAVDETAIAFAACAERQLEAKAQGAAFCKTTAAIWGGVDVAYTYPVAVGAAASHLRLNQSLTAAMYLQAVIGNLVSAALRLMPLGQTEGQAILADLTPLCESLVAETKEASLDDLYSSAFLSDIAAMQHETLQPRIFRT